MAEEIYEVVKKCPNLCPLNFKKFFLLFFFPSFFLPMQKVCVYQLSLFLYSFFSHLQTILILNSELYLVFFFFS